MQVLKQQRSIWKEEPFFVVPVKVKKLNTEASMILDCKQDEKEHTINHLQSEIDHLKQMIEIKSDQIIKMKAHCEKTQKSELDLRIELSKSNDSVKIQQQQIFKLNQELIKLKNIEEKRVASQVSVFYPEKSQENVIPEQIKVLKFEHLAQLKDLKTYDDEMRKAFIQKNEELTLTNIKLEEKLNKTLKTNEILTRNCEGLENKIEKMQKQIDICDKFKIETDNLKVELQKQKSIIENNNDICLKIENLKNSNLCLTKKLQQIDVLQKENEKLILENETLKKQLNLGIISFESQIKDKTALIENLLQVINKNSEIQHKVNEISNFVTSQKVQEPIKSENNPQFLTKVHPTENKSYQTSQQPINFQNYLPNSDQVRRIQVRSYSKPVEIEEKKSEYVSNINLTGMNQVNNYQQSHNMPIMKQFNQNSSRFNFQNDFLATLPRKIDHEVYNNVQEKMSLYNRNVCGETENKEDNGREEFGIHKNCTRFNCKHASQYNDIFKKVQNKNYSKN